MYNVKPYTPPEEMMVTISISAQKWAASKFTSHFPTLTTHQATAPSQSQQQTDTIALLLAQLQSQKARRETETVTEEKKDENPGFCLIRTETTQLLKMCRYDTYDPQIAYWSGSRGLMRKTCLKQQRQR